MLAISWMSRTIPTVVLSGLLTVFFNTCQTMLRQRWLRHVRRIPKDILYENSLLVSVILGVPNYAIRICLSGKEQNKWEELVMDRSKGSSYIQATLKVGDNIITALEQCFPKRASVHSSVHRNYFTVHRHFYL